MLEYPNFVDRPGFVMTANEKCRWCGKDSKDRHLAGIVAGRWYCHECERFQNDRRQENDSWSV